jgi:hypothetical protein
MFGAQRFFEVRFSRDNRTPKANFRRPAFAPGLETKKPALAGLLLLLTRKQKSRR